MKGHQGEQRWTYMDQHLHETLSSHAAIVGFFVGYQVADNMERQTIKFTRGSAELGIDWKKVPGLTRPDDVGQRNLKLESFRASKWMKKEGDVDFDP